MEFAKFKERKTFGLRVALIDLMEEKKTSEKYVSVVKVLKEKKEDMKNINVVEFLENNRDLKLTDEILSYLYYWCDITVEQAMRRIDSLFMPGAYGIPDNNIRIIESLFRNRAVRDKYSLEFKKRLLKKFKIHEKLVKDFKSILLHLTRDGQIDIELIELARAIDKNKIRINFWWLSENEDVDIDVLDYYSEEELDWLAISYRKDLTFKFISKYIDKLCIELIILNSSDDVVNKLQSRYGEIYQKTVSNMMFKSNEVIKSESHIKFHLEKISGVWGTISKSFLMSDDFMIEHWDCLNKEYLVKYRKLSDRIKALL